MRVAASVTTRHDGGGGRVRWVLGLGLAVAAVLALLRPAPAAAHGAPDEQLPHSLDVALTYPDGGLAEGEQLCLALYAGDPSDFASPVQSHCLGPGAGGALFDGLTHGPYALVVLAPGSAVAGNRYQGQIVRTDVPDDPAATTFSLSLSLSLTAAAAGTTGSVTVSVFGCPPGTDEGGDATAWIDKCDALANDVPVSLNGIGSINDTTAAAVTGEGVAESGRVEFSNLPAGDYQLDGDLPAGAPPPVAVFVESSIDGSITPLEPDATLALLPAEVKSVAYFVLLDPEPDPAADATSGNPDIAGAPPAGAPTPPAGLGEPAVTGGLPADPPAATPTPDD